MLRVVASTKSRCVSTTTRSTRRLMAARLFPVTRRPIRIGLMPTTSLTEPALPAGLTRTRCHR